MKERFDTSAWNVYLFGYGEIQEPGHKSNLMTALESVGAAKRAKSR